MSASEHGNREVTALQMKRRCHLKRESVDSTDSTRTAVRLSRGLQSEVCGEPSWPDLLRTWSEKLGRILIFASKILSAVLPKSAVRPSLWRDLGSSVPSARCAVVRPFRPPGGA